MRVVGGHGSTATSVLRVLQLVYIIALCDICGERVYDAERSDERDAKSSDRINGQLCKSVSTMRSGAECDVNCESLQARRIRARAAARERGQAASCNGVASATRGTFLMMRSMINASGAGESNSANGMSAFTSVNEWGSVSGSECRRSRACRSDNENTDCRCSGGIRARVTIEMNMPKQRNERAGTECRGVWSAASAAGKAANE